MARARSTQNITACAACHSFSCTKCWSERAERRQSMARAGSPGWAAAVLPERVAQARAAAAMLAEHDAGRQMARARQQRRQRVGERLGAGAQRGHAANAGGAAPGLWTSGRQPGRYPGRRNRMAISPEGPTVLPDRRRRGLDHLDHAAASAGVSPAVTRSMMPARLSPRARAA